MDTASIDFYGGNEKWKFQPTEYFRLERGEDRWWLVDPNGNRFLTIGLNHADESNLKYPHNLEIWKKKYGSREKWIRGGLVKDLKNWGFNTIGWTGEYISGDWGVALDWFGDPIDLGHSAAWSTADFETANSPYCLQIRVAEIEDWNGQPSFPDDLVLGDRYNSDKGIPAPVLNAMQSFVDVLSVQYFGSGGPEGHKQMKEDLARWHEQTGKPVINADIGDWTPTTLNPNRVSGIESQSDRAQDYMEAISTLIQEPWFLAWHWCAYVENTARGWGVKDP